MDNKAYLYFAAGFALVIVTVAAITTLTKESEDDRFRAYWAGHTTGYLSALEFQQNKERKEANDHSEI